MTTSAVDVQQKSVTPAGGIDIYQIVAQINEEVTAGLAAQGGDALAIETIAEREELGSHICLELAGKQLAISLAAVLEAGNLHTVQSLPLLPDWLTGITNLRGEIVSVVHLGLFLQETDASQGNDMPSYLVVHNEEIKIAITVDKILGTRSLFRPLKEDAFTGTDGQKPNYFFNGWACYQDNDEEKIIALFDLKSFLSSDRLQNLATAKS